MRYLQDKAGTIYEWNEILAENPSFVEVTEEEALLLWQKKVRHAKNIAEGKMSATYWVDKVK